MVRLESFHQLIFTTRFFDDSLVGRTSRACDSNLVLYGEFFLLSLLLKNVDELMNVFIKIAYVKD